MKKVGEVVEESKSVSFADDIHNMGTSSQAGRKQRKKSKKQAAQSNCDDEPATIEGENEVDRIVSESKAAIERRRSHGIESLDEESKSGASSLSSYDAFDETASKGKYKCRSCVQSFLSKKLYQSHRKTLEHKIREKKYSQDHAKQAEINADQDVRFETTFKMACPECGKAFETEDEFKVHGAADHDGIEFEAMEDIVKQRSVVAWKIHFFPLFNAQEYANAAEGCKVACGVRLKTRDDIIKHFFTNHSILNYCAICRLVLPCDIMRFHKLNNCDNIEAIKQMDEEDRKKQEEEKKEKE